MLSYYPDPKVYSNFVTTEECERLIDCNRDKMKRATCGGKSSGRVSPDREAYSSSNTDMDFNKVLFNRVKERIKSDVYTYENLQIIKYEQNGFYKEHLDNPLDVTNKKNSHLRRDYTLILILNDDYEGGETYFPYLKKRFRLKRGDALFFQNYDNRGGITRYASHGGDIVKRGEKWIANLWLR